MPDLAITNDTEIIAKVVETAEIVMIFKVHTYGVQTVAYQGFDNGFSTTLARDAFLEGLPREFQILLRRDKTIVTLRMSQN